MKSNQGEFMQFVLAFLVLFLHRIPVFGDGFEIDHHCNRSCGSRTVPYPFGFSKACPYMLDRDCSETGEVYLKGFPVLDFTNSSIIIQPWQWQSRNNKPNCDKNEDSLTNFIPQFGLTSRNILLFSGNCTELDFHNFNITDLGFNITDLRSNSYQYGRENCKTNISGSITSFMTPNNTKWFPWKSHKVSTCKYVLSFLLSHNASSTTDLEFDKLELGWWMNGTCRPNSCSANANCSDFKNPNNETCCSTVNLCSYPVFAALFPFICHCNEGFEGDGFSEGSRCLEDSVNTPAMSPAMRPSHGKKFPVVGAICVFISGSATVGVIVLLYCCCQRYHRALKTRRSTERLLSANGGPLNIPVYTYREMEIATKGFSSEQKLGTGGFGTVYAGKLPGRSVFAVKKLRHTDTQGMEQVLNEIRLLSSVDHPNLVRLLGCCLEKGEPILVYEFMPNGTLSQHLQREKGEGLSWRTRATIAAETAGALAYLHSVICPPIYHRDVKSSNILLDDGFNVKVADFGLSMLVVTDASHISTKPQGTPGYLDPQYHENFHLTDKSDVYSFGVVLVEIITALKVVDFSRKEEEKNLALFAVKKIGGGCVDEIIDPFLEIDKDRQVRAAVHRVAELAFRCLAFDRDARPTMVEVAQELEFIAYDKSSLHSIDSTGSGMNIDFSDSISPTVRKISGAVVQDSWPSSRSSR